MYFGETEVNMKDSNMVKDKEDVLRLVQMVDEMIQCPGSLPSKYDLVLYFYHKCFETAETVAQMLVVILAGNVLQLLYCYI